MWRKLYPLVKLSKFEIGMSLILHWETKRLLAEWSHPTQEIRSSNPVIGNFSYYLLYQFQRTKIKKKRPQMSHFAKNNEWP